MSEKTLWNRLRAEIQRQKLGGRWQRVENGVATGMPDVNFCINGLEGWIELKHGKKPIKGDTIVFKSQRGMEQAQVNWHFDQHRNGGVSWILIQLDKAFFAVKGADAARVNVMSMDEMAKFEVSLGGFLTKILEKPVEDEQEPGDFWALDPELVV